MWPCSKSLSAPTGQLSFLFPLILPPARYADRAMRDWQCTHMNIEIQDCGENCAVFVVWHVLAIIWSLSLCTNLLARRLRKIWFPFILWAVGGSELRLRPAGGGSPLLPSSNAVVQSVNEFFGCARREFGLKPVEYSQPLLVLGDLCHI